MPDTGWLEAGVAENIELSLTPWFEPEKAILNDDQTTSWAGSDEAGNQLYVRLYAASIPSGATVTGVTIEIDSTTFGVTTARLTKDGTNLSSINAAVLSGVNQYGGGSNLWGYSSISEAEAESGNFGVILSPYATGIQFTAIDYVFLRFTYLEPITDEPEVLRVSSSGRRW